MGRHRSKFILTLLGLTAIVLGGLVFISAKRAERKVPEFVSYASVETDITAKHGEESVASPDAKSTLTIITKDIGEGVVSQTFLVSVSDEDGEGVEVFSQDSQSDELVEVPFNTFSPDNKYILLRQKNEYLVVRSDGVEIKGSGPYVKVAESFHKEYPDFVVTDVTGWGGTNLIIVNTNYPNGDIGPSFWFDVSSLTFTRLTTRFN